MQQSINVVGGLGKAPFDAQVGAKSDDKDALASLRHAIVGSVDQRGRDVISEFAAMGAAGYVLGLETREVAPPVLPVLACHLRELQLQEDVLVVVGE